MNPVQPGCDIAGAMPQFIETPVLNIAYEETGDPSGWPVLLMHGFPYDVHAYDGVAPILANAGARVIVPSLRGYGQTRFRSPETIRSGEQAALGKDLLDLLDGLAIPRAILAGYDWGGRAACVVAALWPERVRGLVSQNSYNIHDIAKSGEPKEPSMERRLWYQYYFHGERGTRRARAKPAGDGPSALAALVTDMEVRRSDVRAHGRKLWQS